MRLALFITFLFFLLKLPLSFAPSHPEELRDFDAYKRTASAEMPYKDYAWQYGPLAPLLYGGVLKVFPARLLTLRLAGLFFWCLTTFLVALICQRIISSRPWAIVGALIATSLFQFPTYTFNHIPATLGAVLCVYGLIMYLSTRKERDLFLGLVGLLLCLFIRPVLMGYGLLFMCVTFCALKVPSKNWLKYASVFAGSCAILALIFFFLYGPNFHFGFRPPRSMIQPAYSYPNLHYLVPQPHPGATMEWWAKSVRAAQETFLFYFHFFVWPSVLLTLGILFGKRSQGLWIASFLAILSLALSTDVLHYGHPDPYGSQYMAQRGQYFFVFTVLSILAFFHSAPFYSEVPALIRKFGKVLKFGLPLFIVSWVAIPSAVAYSRILSLPFNPRDYDLFRGVAFISKGHPIFDAVDWLNSQCQPDDKVAIMHYDPWASALLKCQDIFARDTHTFQRSRIYELAEGESPYPFEKGATGADFINRRLEEEKPKFVLGLTERGHSGYCLEGGWKYKDFGKGLGGRRVCWR
jgi:hypothetical protein